MGCDGVRWGAMGDAEITWLVRHISLISPLAYVHVPQYDGGIA
nr:MAG TPA: hypothetical protein [Caudoviricetes sp.]